jgi:hypothetical protein
MKAEWDSWIISGKKSRCLLIAENVGGNYMRVWAKAGGRPLSGPGGGARDGWVLHCGHGGLFLAA